jgi:hypothetical protein
MIHNWGRGEGGVQDRARSRGIVVLMSITFHCNGAAVFLWNRFDKRW